MKAQLRFARTAEKEKKKKYVEDLPLSNEMSSWLEQTFSATDENGYLPEVVGSVLTQPLDSFAAFCPTGNLLNSKFSSVKIPQKNYSTQTVSDPSQPVVNFGETVNRLNIMWLQRRAQLEKEDGDLNSAYNTIQQALDQQFGHQPYEKCGISEPVPTNDPLELLVNIEKNYFPYDATSHRIADKIQRWYHRWYSKKMKAATIVQKKYRRYLKLRQVWRNLQVQLQCSKLIQRRFRRHLKRMHMLATKLKAWYRMKVKVREFKYLIRFFRAARLIQRLMRGVWGRRRAARKRLERDSAQKIQRNIRGYICRHRRAWGLAQFHKIFYYAALKIQCFFRKIIAVTRCKRRLLEEIVREEMRMEKERNIRDETIQLEMARTRIYLQSPAGKLHFEACKKKILAQDEEFNSKKSLMSPQDILSHDAMIIFEIYDNDGSGTIDAEELKHMLLDLCVSVDGDEFLRLVHQLDEDGSGDIDFEEFVDWYTNGGSDGSGSVGGIVFKQILKARRLVLDMSGETLRRRTERAVLRQCCSWLSNETKSMFRMTQPPKYNCCRCLQPFILFTDYIRHFKGSGENRVCCITGERALFYPKFWIQRDWIKQRQCEAEVMRVTFEYPCLTYKAMMAVYSELAILSNPELSFFLSSQISAAKEMYLGILEFGGQFYSKSLPDHIFDVANLCNDGFLSPNIAKCVGQCLQESLPSDWIVHENWSLNLFQEWVSELPQLQRPPPPPTCSVLKCCESVNKIRDRDAFLLGNIFVRCVRLLLVGAETSLISLADYRLKRPRRIIIPDGELKKMKLYMLTQESFDNVRVKLIKRLRVIREALRRLQICSINYYKLQANRNLFSKVNRYFRKTLGLDYAQIEITEDPTDEEIETYEIEGAHIRAKAHFQNRSRTRIGKAHVKRAKYELWAKKKRIMEQKNLSDGECSQIVMFIDYLMNIFCIPEYNQNKIHRRDFDLLFKYYFSLNIPTAALEDIFTRLDPMNSGFVEKENLVNWLLSGQSNQYCSKWLQVTNVTLPFFSSRDAELKILCDMRRIIRFEIESQKQALKVIDALLEAEESQNIKGKKIKLKIKGLQDESESTNERLKTLKLTFDKQEQRVLSRMSEDDAEASAKFKILFSKEGRYFLAMETLLMKIAKETISAFGEVVPEKTLRENNFALSQCLNVLINCFDTDCSGTFDESEITLLLKCVKCPLEEKWVLYHFPAVVVGSSTISEVTTFLLPRVGWRRELFKNRRFLKEIQFSTKSFLYSSSLLLISSARQSARERSDQAAELAKTGILLGNDSSDSDNFIVSEGLLVRSQLLAVRQTHEFLKTPFGVIRTKMMVDELTRLWSSVISNDYSKKSLIQYSFEVHRNNTSDSIESARMLNSELPHLIRFLCLRFRWTIKTTSFQALSSLFKFTEESDARWMDFDEIVQIIETSIEINGYSISSSKSSFRSDSRKRLESLSRQQAVLIAIRYPDKDVKETNYRCFILGLYRCLEMQKQTDLISRSSIDWGSVPFEAMLIYLLGQGFTYEDLVMNRDFFQSDDIIDYDHLVDPDEILSKAMDRIFSGLTCLSSVHRMGRYFLGFKFFKLYEKVVILLKYHNNEINTFGRMFLNEILSGVSHCSFET